MRVAAAVAAVLSVAAGSAAAADGWRTAPDRAGGYSIAVPATWQVVPRSTAELDAHVARLRAQKRMALAYQFAQIAAVRRATHTAFRFQAFSWPAPRGQVVPDVTVKIDPLSPGATPAALPRIAGQIAKTLAAAPTATATSPVGVRLPAGAAQRITGTTQISKTVRSRFALYLLIHGRRLYSVTFRGPATSVEREIVRRFRVTST